MEAFQLVATAYETLNEPEKRQLYDDGVDLSGKKKKKKKKSEYDESSSESEDEDGNKKKSLREEVRLLLIGIFCVCCLVHICLFM